jgi:hypothetical protein
MPFPYSITTRVRCAAGVSARTALRAVEVHLVQAGAGIRSRSDAGFIFDQGKPRGRHWLTGVSNGKISAREAEDGITIVADIAYPAPLVFGTVGAIVLAALASPLIAAIAWLWVVGGNYLIALFSVRSYLTRAASDSVAPAT